MPDPVLYSTNPWFTEIVCGRYRGGTYRVWCSELFDPKSRGPLDPAVLTAPSSSPKPLYYHVLDAVRASDSGNAKVQQYRTTFERLADEWLSGAEISDDDHADILGMMAKEPWRIWEPRLYVIPRQKVEADGRLSPVAVADRAGVGPEFQIFDLHRAEFDMIVLEP